MNDDLSAAFRGFTQSVCARIALQMLPDPNTMAIAVTFGDGYGFAIRPKD